MRHQQPGPSQCSNSAALPARRLRPWRTALSSLVLLVLAICGLLAVPAPVAAAKEPSVQVNRFVTLPSRVSYFEDSTVVLWHSREEGNVWRSDDEGKSWSPVSGPDKGEMDQLIQHPYYKSTVRRNRQGRSHAVPACSPDAGEGELTKGYRCITGIHPDQAQGALENNRSRQDLAEVHDAGKPGGEIHSVRHTFRQTSDDAFLDG